MATSAQVTANQSNAQHSTGPKTPLGKAVSAHNNFRYGFTGVFSVLPWENQGEFDALFTGLCSEHQPATPTEAALIEKMAQALWLGKRALLLQELTFKLEMPACIDEKQLALFIRYQTTHDRAFHKCLDQLLKLRAEKLKQEIGFESQERKRKENDHKQADQSRRQAAENRKQELHHYSVLLGEAKLDHQLVLNSKIQSVNACATRQEEQPIAA
jgi:hypothetical protein